jgi:hypothetical protein
MAQKMSDVPQPAWRKSSFCQAGECVEVAQLNEEIILRSTRSPSAVVRLTADEWHAFAQGMRAGEFDEIR